MTHPGFATVQVRTELSLGELCALYWDALIHRFGPQEGDAVNWATRMVDWAYSEFTGPQPVKALVREWITWYGERSVECGPKNEYPSDELEARVKAIVARAYKIVY